MSADVAAQKSAAVLIHSIGEVLTGHADTGPLPALKLLLVDEVPFLHAPKLNSTTVLAGALRVLWGLQSAQAGGSLRLSNANSYELPIEFACLYTQIKNKSI